MHQQGGHSGKIILFQLPIIANGLDVSRGFSGGTSG
jgi:hypothetical protein